MRSKPQRSGAQQPEMLCRTPSLRSAAELCGGHAAASAQSGRRLCFLISGMAASLICAIGLYSRVIMIHPGLTLYQSLLRWAGCIDDCPIDRTDIIFLLKPGDFGRGVGCIARAAADAAQSGGKIGYEKEADKPDIQPMSGVPERAAPFHVP